MERLNELVRKASEEWMFAGDFIEMGKLFYDKSIPVEERLEPLRPFVFGDFEKLNGWMQEVYEDLLGELPDDDQMVDEYYDYFSEENFAKLSAGAGE